MMEVAGVSSPRRPRRPENDLCRNIHDIYIHLHRVSSASQFLYIICFTAEYGRSIRDSLEQSLILLSRSP